MEKQLRTLIVEDSDDDTELLLRELRRAGYAPIHQRVDTREAMIDELRGHEWDVVFSDFTMPHFNAFDALAVLRNSGHDLPFIIVSGTIGEDRAVVAMKAGAHDYILKGNLKRLAPAVERELREARMRHERRQAEETIRRLAYSDPVTGLPNRTRFRECLQEAIDQALRTGNALGLLILDIDRFQEVNDALGPSRGDRLLQQVGMRLQGPLFAPDIVARIGGDEFGILLPNVSTSEVITVIKKLQDFLQPPFMIDGIPIVVETSIGVAALPDHASDADGLLQRAQTAMCQAKRMASGYRLYAAELDSQTPQRLALMAQLRDAIDNNQLRLHFQPQVDLKRRRVVGVEALVRWQHPQLGLLLPDAFIGAAEYTGLMAPLTRWVLTQALTRARELQDRGIDLRMSINLSARSLHDPHLTEIVKSALRDQGVRTECLTLEITESAIVLDPARAQDALATLSRMGIAISIDDFGTGYTSLASIKRLPVNEIKIDKSFVMGMLANKSDTMIVRSVIDLGHNLGLRTVAEGVETEESFAALAALGCDEVQGFWISRPQSAETLQAWIEASPWQVGRSQD